MSNTRFDYWKSTALGVFLALSLAQGASANRTSGPGAATDGPDLSSEARTIDSFGDDFANYDKKRSALSKRATLTNEEFSALERTGQDLKRRVPQFRDAIQSFINKLKAGGRWDTLDEDILAKLTDGRDRAFVRDNGGLRRIFEDTLTQLNSQAAEEITAPLSSLRSKVAQHREFRFDDVQAAGLRLVAASYEPANASPPTPLFGKSLACRIASARYGIGVAMHGIDPQTGKGNVRQSTLANYECHCNNNCGGAVY